MTDRQSSTEASATGACLAVTPALLKAQSRRPCRATICSIISFTCPACVMSQQKNSAAPPAAAICSSACAPCVRLRPQIATVAPAAANARATASPIPLVPPVTRAILCVQFAKLSPSFGASYSPQPVLLTAQNCLRGIYSGRLYFGLTQQYTRLYLGFALSLKHRPSHRHLLICASRPSRVLFTRSLSAKIALAMPTRSAVPSSISLSAFCSESTKPANPTGTRAYSLICLTHSCRWASMPASPSVSFLKVSAVQIETSSRSTPASSSSGTTVSKSVTTVPPAPMQSSTPRRTLRIASWP